MSAINNNSRCVSGLRAWIITLSAALFFAYVFFQMNLLNPINGALVKEFGLGGHQISQLFSFLTYGNILLLFPAGILLDRFSVKKIILFCFAVALAGGYIFANAHSFATLVLARFIIGCAAAFSFVSAMKVASMWIEPRRLAIASGLIVALSSLLGGLMSQAPLACLVAKMGWRGALLFISHIGVACWLLQLLILKDTPRSEDVTPQNAAAFFTPLRQAMGNPQNWLAGLFVCFVNVPVFILGGLWGSVFLSHLHNFSSLEAASITGMSFLGMLIGSPLVGAISDSLKRRKITMIMGALLSIGCILILTFCPAFPLLGEEIFFFIFGLCASSQVLGYPLIPENNPPAITATATSIISLLVVSGGVFTELYGKILDYVDGAQVAVHSAAAYLKGNYLLLGCTIAALFVALIVRETYCRPFTEQK